jgi:hypothetical protein
MSKTIGPLTHAEAFLYHSPYYREALRLYYLTIAEMMRMCAFPNAGLGQYMVTKAGRLLKLEIELAEFYFKVMGGRGCLRLSKVEEALALCPVCDLPGFVGCSPECSVPPGHDERDVRTSTGDAQLDALMMTLRRGEGLAMTSSIFLGHDDPDPEALAAKLRPCESCGLPGFVGCLPECSRQAAPQEVLFSC